MSPPRNSGFVVEPRYCGPPRSGNGGYVCGRMAAYFDGPIDVVEVTLRSPPPLGVQLRVSEDADGLLLRYEEALIAQAKSVDLIEDPPAAVDFDQAVEAAHRYAGRRDHPFPTCFVCGLDRARGDGMRLQPGSVGQSRVAAAWQPHESLREGTTVGSEFTWAALDCPGGWAINLSGRPMVLGRMAARVLKPAELGRSYVIVGQLRGLDGRKAFTVSALYSSEAELLGHAEATWLAVDPDSVRPVSSQSQPVAH